MANTSNSEPTEQLVKTPVKSRGDKVFDWFVYGGMNFVGTFVLTIPLAYWAMHGKGKPFFDKLGEGVKNLGLPPGAADKVVTTSALFLGGSVMVAPVRLAESMRTSIVSALNRNEKPLGASEEPYRHPPQTWGSLIKGRLLAWAAVFSSLQAIKWVGYGEALGKFEHRVAEKSMKLFKKQSYTLPAEDVTALKALGTKEALETLEHAETKAYKYGKLAALDVFATAAATMLLYVGSRFFAKHRPPEVQERLIARQNQRPNADVAADGETPLATPAAVSPETRISGDKQAAGTLSQETPLLQAGM